MKILGCDPGIHGALARSVPNPEFEVRMTPELPIAPPRPKNTHIFAKAEGLHYVDPEWLSVRLFEVERFPKLVWDPFAGWGRIAEAARAAGYRVRATDIADRGYPHLDGVEDFFAVDHVDSDVSIVGNPPFDDEIVRHAIALDPIKLALIWPFARIVPRGLGSRPRRSCTSTCSRRGRRCRRLITLRPARSLKVHA